MKKVIADLYSSLTNNPGGLSARKLTALFGVLVAAYETYQHTDKANVTTIVMIWLAASFLCLGIITFEQLEKLKNGNNGNSNT